MNTSANWENYICLIRFVTYCLAVTDDAVRQYDPRYDSAPGCRFGDRALFLTQILTQNRKFRYGQGSTKGKIPFEYPYRTAPDGRIRTEKTP